MVATTLAAAVSATDTTITVADASEFDGPQWHGWMGGEPIDVVDGPPDSATWAVIREVGAGGTQLVLDQFARTEPSSFGATPEGYDWIRDSTTADLILNVDGTRAQIFIQNASAIATPTLLFGPATRDVGARWLIEVPALPVGGSIDLMVTLREQAAAGGTLNHYRARTTIAATGAITSRLQKLTGGSTVTNLAADTATGVTLAAGDQYWCAFQALGASPTTVQQKVWKATDPEPSSWLTSTTDSEAVLQGGGFPGMRIAGVTATSFPISLYLHQYEVRSIPSLGTHSIGDAVISEDAWAYGDGVRIASGAPTDHPPDGSRHYDYAANRLYIHIRGVWHYVAFT